MGKEEKGKQVRAEVTEKDSCLSEEGAEREEKVNGLAASGFETAKRLTSEIEDGISDAVCELLYRLARDVPEAQVIVEVGRGKGKSTIWLAKGSEAGNRNNVYSFSSQKESLDHVKASGENMNTEFTASLEKAGVQNALISFYPDHEETARRWKKKIGLLWVNTSGEYEDVKEILLSWERHLSTDAMVVVHGCDQRGTGQVIKEHVGSLGDLMHKQSVDATMVLTFDKCMHYWIINSHEIGLCKYCGRTRNFKRMRSESSQMETWKRGNDRKSN